MPPAPHCSRTETSFGAGLALLLALAAVVACGGSGGGGGSGGDAAQTGSVAVLLTDGPVDPDDFEHILVTFTEIILIGEPGQVSVFRDPDGKTVDLRDVEDVSKFVALGRRIPIGRFSKIRLLLKQIELVPADGGDPIFPKLPPKLDLNPQSDFFVRSGTLLKIQIDFQAGMSLHIVAAGNGKVLVRPVVFVDVLEGPLLGKLVLLQGTVRELDREGETFLLCDTHAVSRPAGGDRVTFGAREGDDPDDRDDFCVEIVVTGDTSFFDEAGDPAGLDDVMEGDPAWVLGRFLREDDDGRDDDRHHHDGEDLVFEAEVVQLGEDVIAVDGETLTEVDGTGRFRIELDPGQGIVTDDGTLPIQLQPGSRIFRRKGLPLEPEDIMVGDPVRASGVLALSSASDDVLKAAVVVVDVATMETERLEGQISGIEGDGARLQLQTEAGVACVDVPTTARVFLVTVDDDEGSAVAGDRSDLRVGDRVNVFGSSGACFTAETVIVFDDDEAFLAAAFGGGGLAASVVATAAAGPGDPGAEEEDREEADGSAGVEVFDIGPRRVEAGLSWATLPEETPDER
jgi:hypothetical protein